MDRNKQKTVRRGRRKTGIRKKVLGMPERPRLSIFRSAKHIYGQVIDDLSGRTLVSASSRDKGEDSAGGNVDGARKVGSRLVLDRILLVAFLLLPFAIFLGLHFFQGEEHTDSDTIKRDMSHS